MHKIKILLAEDHRTVRESLRLMIDSQRDMEVAGEVDDGASAVERVRAHPPDVVVLDISMPGMNGLLAARALRQVAPGVKIVVLTRHNDEAYFCELLRAGVSAYVLKQSAATELLEAIRAVMQGREFIDASLTSRLARLRRRRGVRVAAPQLSEREEEVLRHVVWGQGNKEIAALLGVSVKTIEVHKSNAMKKLGALSRLEVVRFGVLKGWLQDPPGP